MAGHSKWANTRHRKAAQDAKRGKIFTKIIRELVTAAKLGGGDPDANPRLRAAIDKALSNNMTRDTLNRAIARGVGGDDVHDAVFSTWNSTLNQNKVSINIDFCNFKILDCNFFITPVTWKFVILEHS